MKARKMSNKKQMIVGYEIVVCVIIIIVELTLFFKEFDAPLNFFVAILGLVSGISLLKNKWFGFYLSILWATLQIIVIQIGNKLIDLTQFIYFTLPYIKLVELENYPDIIFLPNLVGIILLALIIFWRKELK